MNRRNFLAKSGCLTLLSHVSNFNITKPITNIENNKSNKLIDENYRCECEFCIRNRKFNEIIEKLPKEDQKWMGDFLDYVVDVESENEMLEYWNSKVKEYKDE